MLVRKGRNLITHVLLVEIQTGTDTLEKSLAPSYQTKCATKHAVQ